MSKPRISVLGVYRLKITSELIREQRENLYPETTDERENRHYIQLSLEQLQSVALLELLVENPDSTFRMIDFTQSQKGVRRDSWQVAWQEVFLTSSGDKKLETEWPALPEEQSFRVAFYLHDFQAREPLLTSYGPMDCPRKKTMPKRLERLAPYTPTD